MAAVIEDTRIVYGAGCMWWDRIQHAGTRRPGADLIDRMKAQNPALAAALDRDVASGPGLPCCPHCGGMLFEMASEEEWWTAARKLEADSHPGYVAFLTWARGKCFPTYEDATMAYELREQ